MRARMVWRDIECVHEMSFVNSPRGRMPNGSSIWTPISSMPSSKKQMMAEAGTMAQWQLFHRVKGISPSQITKNLEVCLHQFTEG